jgi:putative tricarboxylic transport membrane protein
MFRKVVPYAIVLVAASVLYVAATQFQFTPRRGRLGPDVWPKTLLILMALACVFQIGKTLIFGRRDQQVEGLLEAIQEKTAAAHQDDVAQGPAASYPRLLVLGIALTAGYVLLFDVLGFFVDTLVFTCLFVVVGRYRKPWVILATGALSSLAFMFVFMKVVYVSLPLGIAPFSSVSLALMRLMGIR